MPFAQETEPQPTLVAACSQAPPDAHLPSLPQVVVTAHCPLGAGLPAVTLLQLPSATPVRARVQAWQVPVQAVLQQTLLTQEPLAHWSPAVQLEAGPLVGLQVPLVVSHQLPAPHCPSVVHAAQTMDALQ
jgi:hypothetical protein